MVAFIAHAGEEHESVLEASSHVLLTEWYVALPLLFAVLMFLSWVVITLTKSLAAAVLTICGGLLVVGVSMYSLSPIVSVVCISLGFAIILFQVMTELRGPKKS